MLNSRIFTLMIGLTAGMCQYGQSTEASQPKETTVCTADASACESPLLSVGRRDYSFGYWLNGMRKHKDDTTADVLCIGSGHFGFEMEIEWMTFHRESDDYYGPNEAYRQHLIEHLRSWKTIYREAAGND